jgi:hypothetical protein
MQYEASRMKQKYTQKDRHRHVILLHVCDPASQFGLWVGKVCQQMQSDVNGHLIPYTLNEEDASIKIKLTYGV